MAHNDESSKPFQSLRLNVKNIEKSTLPTNGADAATTLAGEPLTTRSDDNTPEESDSIFRSNMFMSQNGGLIMYTETSSALNLGNISVWDDAARDLWNHTKAAEKFKIRTKDIDFGDPSRRKKIYKIYVTFKCQSYTSGIKVNYTTNGSTSFTGTFQDTTYYTNAKGFDAYNAGTSSSQWITVGLKPSSNINNVYSIALRFSYADGGQIQKIAAHPSPTTITLTSSSSTDDYYNGMPVFFYSGPGYGQIRKVIDYNGSTQVATLSSALNTEVTTSTSYDLGYIHSSFEINDISILYREKAIK